MNSQRTRTLLLMLITAVALFGCGLLGPAAQSTPVVDQPLQPGQPAQATEAVAAPQASPTAEAVAPKARTRGPGDFNLLAPTVGLETLTSYRASLELVFEGTRDGAPYNRKQTYEQVVDRPIDAHSLLHVSTGADGAVKQTFSAAFGGVRYLQGAPDQPCQASALDSGGPTPFEPAMLLPLLEGAEAAGEETVGDVPALVYTFDALALNAFPGAKAAGKLWVAKEGGWLVKYELGLRSETLFGPGIAGEQRWNYTLSEANTAGFSLPEACPQGEVDLPLPDGGQVKASLPSFQKLSAPQAPEALVTFYTETLLAQFWTQQGLPVTGENGTRLVFSRAVQDKEQMAVITIRAAEGGSVVTIYELLTDPVIQ